MNLYFNAVSETTIIFNNANVGYAVPPLETAGTVVLMISTGTIASLAVANGWSSTDLSSIGLATSGLSSSAGTGTGSGLREPEMVSRLGKYFGQSHRIVWFVPL